MSIVARFENGWRLFKTTLVVIRRHPKLMAFPAMISLFMLGILAFFIAPVLIQPTGHGYGTKEHWTAVAESVFTKESLATAEPRSASPGSPSRSAQEKPQLMLTRQGAVYLAVFYFASMFFATFFSVAFYHEILQALGGGAVSLSGGLRFAMTRLPAIFLWSMFAGLVGYLIKTLEERVGLIGRIVLRFVGVAWSVASVFAIPILVTEDVKSPMQVLRQSAATIKKTWGEALLGFLGLQFGGLIVILVSLVLLGGGIFLSALLKSPLLIAVAGGIWILWLFTFFYVMGVANHVYRGALYLFASRGAAPDPFDAESMALAWKVKKTP
jgi:hypothetical protein